MTNKSKRSGGAKGSTSAPPDTQTADDVPASAEDILAPLVSNVADAEAARQAADAALFAPADPSPASETRPVDSVRPRRGRPPGSKSKAGIGRPPAMKKADMAVRIEQLEAELRATAPDAEQVVQSVKPALQVTFKLLGQLLAQVRGPHWAFSDAETDMLSEAWAEPLAPYLAESGVYLTWATAVGVTYIVAAPRLAKDKANTPAAIEGDSSAVVVDESGN